MYKYRYLVHTEKTYYKEVTVIHLLFLRIQLKWCTLLADVAITLLLLLPLWPIPGRMASQINKYNNIKLSDTFIIKKNIKKICHWRKLRLRRDRKNLPEIRKDLFQAAIQLKIQISLENIITFWSRLL